MRKIDALIPERGRPDRAALGAHDPDALARYVLDTGNAWWRRHICAQTLAGRVPPARIPGLADRIRDRREPAEVRIALLEALADRSELLPWLRAHDPEQDGDHGMPEAVLTARGRLGDPTAARPLATLADSYLERWRKAGEAGLDGLVEHHGVEAVLAALGEERPEDRRFALRLRHRAGQDVTAYLADPDRGVAHLAQSLAGDPDRLLAFLDGTPPLEAAVHAACALHRLTGDRARTRRIDERLGSPRTEVAGLDEEVRRALVHAYAPSCERRSDPRWRLEALVTEPPGRPDPAARLARATEALASAGLDPGPAVPVGDPDEYGEQDEYDDQDDGVAHRITCPGLDVVFVSGLGRFVTGRGDDRHPARRPLEEAGFRWIDGPTGRVEVTGLYVLSASGSRGPRPLATLLF
ncbi:hypothetical protein ACFW6S_32605 [Streptomyces sp. NPDC058740]|uniref:hypothetical protein n=1 Tax=unclassified Streptomyces TaxID=2593676 RepID=UPI00367A5E5B